ncbi:MAG: hypothetical protein KAU20_03795, partial [Nanoarchaeota archaeon]|nr:hypothetical protein [Nanoarchaeota archaeon]
ERTESTKKIGTTKLMEELGIHKEDKLKEILTNLDFRGNRILLPEAVTNITKFNDKDEYSLISEKDYLIIKKFAVSSKKK